jgi:hypothetical protein
VFSQLEQEDELEDDVEAAVEGELNRSRDSYDGRRGNCRDKHWQFSAGLMDSSGAASLSAGLGPLQRKTGVYGRPTLVTMELEKTGDSPMAGAEQTVVRTGPPVRFNDLSASVEVGLMCTLSKRDDFTVRGSYCTSSMAGSGKRVRSKPCTRNCTALLPCSSAKVRA